MNSKPEINYIVKPQDRVVVCVIKNKDNGVKCSGVAKCHPEDAFNEELGKEVARRRAIIKYKKLILSDIRCILDNIKARKTDLCEEEKYFLRRAEGIKESIGKLYTEIDNTIEFYSK